MTKEELKLELQSYRDIKAEREQIKDLLAEIESRMASPRGGGSDGLPRSSGSGDPMIGIVSRHISLEEKYKLLQCQLDIALVRIESLIEKLDSRDRRMMRCYYVQGMTWAEVSSEINYSERQIHRLHNDALDRIIASLA